MPVVVRVVEEIKNAVGTCAWASPPVVDLRLGITADGLYVVVIREVVQCALLNTKRKANEFLVRTASQHLAETLGITGGNLATARWPLAAHAQATCEVRHIAQVLDWAVARHGGDKWLPVEQRAELAAAVRKTVCDLARKELTCMTGSIGVDIAMVVEEVRRLRTDLQNAKARTEDAITQLPHMHTELSGVWEEASRGSTALAAAHSELAEKVRLRTQLQQHLIDLKAELQAAQEELAHMHAPGPLLLVEEDASMNETRDQVI